jgi:ABC-type uncharacterized transport system involved in gliding motility auxiliary subunit
LAPLLGGLGAVALCFALLTAFLAAFQPATDLAWVWGNLFVGVVLVGVWAFLNFEALRERLSSGESRRAGKHGSSALLTAVLTIGILGTLGWLATQYNHRFDWSEAGVHTLTGQTLDVLESLESDVQMTAFFNKLDAPPIRDLLQRYEYASERVKLEFADPTERPDLVAAYEIDEEDLARGLVRVAIGDQSVELAEFGEAQITNALVNLTRSGGKKVYFLEGHNERIADPDSNVGAGKEGISRAAEALRNETYAVETLLLAAAGDVPEDADALILAGPTRPFLDEEHAALQRYLERGGALFVLVDPRARTDITTDLEAWGVRLGDDVIVDQSLALFGRATSPFASSYSEEHPITRELSEVVLFHMVRSVEILPGAESRLEPIAFTGESSWAERNLEGWEKTGRAQFDEGDLEGPVPVAVAGNPIAVPKPPEEGTEPAEARIVVVGDSDFATNEVLDTFGNRDFFVNSVNWLLGDTEHISIRPNTSRASRFALSSEEFMRIQNLSLFVIPETIAILGVLAWWSRRRGQGR